jgi:hypothetical protein
MWREEGLTLGQVIRNVIPVVGAADDIRLSLGLFILLHSFS